MNKNIIKNLSYIFLAGLAALCSTFGTLPKPPSHNTKYTVGNTQKLLSYMTVALLRHDVDNNHYTAYCAGVWIDENRFITAYHCIENILSSGKITVPYAAALDSYNAGATKFHFTSPRVARIIDIDTNADLALLETKGMVTFHYFANFDNSSIRVGNEIHIIGHTSGLAYTYSHGYISAIRYVKPFFSLRDIKLLQIDGRVYKGNSGGGVFDENGNLLGISSFLLMDSNTPFFIHRDEILNFLKRSFTLN
jgi:S1-C subfamily serine protease